MGNIMLFVALSWVHLSFTIEGNRTSTDSVEQPRQITFAEFYIDTIGLIKIMDFYTIVGNGKDTLHEKNGFYADFQRDSVHMVDFVIGERNSYRLSNELVYLVDASGGSPFPTELKNFEMKIVDSSHAHINLTVVRRGQNDVTILLDGNLEFVELNDSLKYLLTYEPESISASILDLMAAPVTTGEAIFGKIMRTLNKDMLANGTFITSMELDGWLGGNKLFSDKMFNSKIEVVPDSLMSKVIANFRSQAKP